MKTTIFNKKALAFFGAAAILLAAVFTIGCKTDTGSGDPAHETFTVQMKAGEHGTVTANPVIPAGGKVAKDKVITFTAAPASGYKVDKWTITGGAFEAGTGTEGSTTAKVKITANTKVNVSFISETITLPSPTEFTVEMTAGEHGTLSANPVIPASGKVAKDTVITFTAAPASGYKVDKWTITGGAFEAGSGTEGSPTAKVKISADTKVNVSFKTATITPPSPTEFTVEMTHGEHGTVTASPVIPTSGKVAKDTEITFTAAPASGYKVDKWTITGGAFETGTGTEGSTTAKVKITADTKVNVSFISSIYAIVPFGTHGAALDTYLKDTASSADINYIKVTGLTAADLKGYLSYPSRLGKILKDNPTKKVALKLSEVSGLTDMSYCFYDCKSLTQAPVIPSTVTDMSSCFSGCESLTQAPVIPSTVTNMRQCFDGCTKITAVTLKCDYNSEQIYTFPAFKDAFKDCEKLTAGSIKVPSGQLQTYKDNAGIMGAQKEWFVAE